MTLKNLMQTILNLKDFFGVKNIFYCKNNKQLRIIYLISFFYLFLCGVKQNV